MGVTHTDANGIDQQNEASVKASRIVIAPRGDAFSVSSVTGIIAAALVANSPVFAMRLDPSSAPKRAFIERIRLHFTTIVAFTVPITASRRLAIYRGAGAATTGGTAITTVAKKLSTSSDSEFEVAQGGDVRIASTGALGVASITFEANEFATMPLTHVGAAGNFLEQVFEFNASESAQITLEPGQLLAVRNPVAMDAAGTWQLAVRVDWNEAPLWSA